ncbi:MAG: NAD-dependent epimerase/dehydratase family protein [Caldilineaceae bacterium]
MKRAVIIGGKGKVGTYLVPMLVEEGYDVINVSRGDSKPFVAHGCWEHVEQVNLDRDDPEFPQKIAALQPDIVVDKICFTEADMAALIAALAGQVEHYLVTGSIWCHGPTSVAPNTEEEDLNPFGEYGIEKLKMTQTLKRNYAPSHFPGTIIHPGHIVGPGHPPINPQGNANPKVFAALIHGEPVTIANFGLETVHHVHASDVAGVFRAAIRAGSPSYGQSFHAVSPGAVTLRGYANAVASWFGKEANLVFKPFDEFRKDVSEADAESTYGHIMRSSNNSMEKAKRLLGFTPSYSSYAAVRESLDWMITNSVVDI